MNDNLPEINFKEKKEKKRGLLGWLRSKLGFGSRGAAMGEAGINPSAMNVGRALGTAKFGASAGLGSFLAGNAMTIATIAAVAVASGVYLANNAPAPSTGASSAFSSNKSPDNYVPAILRSQAANQGSSLDMFKDTNKGAGLAMEEGAKPAKPEEPKASANEEAASNPDANQAAPDQSNMAESMMGKLQGGNFGSLTSSLGGGSNKMSAMGGFGNKFNQNGAGGKSGFTSGIGTGFAGLPKFDQRKGKMMAMKASSRPVFSSSQAGKKAQFGKGAFNQAKGMRATQKTYDKNNIDSARSTQDKAWEGSTGSGAADGGAGIGDGGAGIVTSPSLDNASGSTGGGGGTGTPDAASIPEVSNPVNVSPWASLVTMIMMLVMVSALLSFIASKLSGSVFGYPIAVIVAGLAAVIAGIALVMSIMLMAQFGQMLLGSLYLIGSALALAAAAAALAGASDAVMGAGPATTVMWLAAGAGVITMMGSMLGGK